MSFRTVKEKVCWSIAISVRISAASQDGGKVFGGAVCVKQASAALFASSREMVTVWAWF